MVPLPRTMQSTKNGSTSDISKNFIALLSAIKLLFKYVSVVKIFLGSVALRWATAFLRLNI